MRDPEENVADCIRLRCGLLAASLLMAAVATAQRTERSRDTAREGSARWDVECLPAQFTNPPPESSAAVKVLRVELSWLREGTAVLVRHGDQMALLEGKEPKCRMLDWPRPMGFGVTGGGHVVLVQSDVLQWRDPGDGAELARSHAALVKWPWDVFCEGERVLLHRSSTSKWFEVDSPGAALREVRFDGTALWSVDTGPCLVYCVADGPSTDHFHEPPGIVRVMAGHRSIFDGYRFDEAHPAQGPMRDRGEALMWIDSKNRVVVAREKRSGEGVAKKTEIERLFPLQGYDTNTVVGLIDRDHVVRANAAGIELFALQPEGARRLQFWQCDGQVVAMQAHPIQNRMLIAYIAGDVIRVRLVDWK